MTDVIFQPWFVGPKYRTEVWYTKSAQLEFADFLKSKREIARRYLNDVARYAESGFDRHEGRNKGLGYKAKWKIYAIQPRATLFRFYGRYETGTEKRVFLIATATLKKEQDMRPKDLQAAAAAADVFESGHWRKEDTNG